MLNQQHCVSTAVVVSDNADSQSSVAEKIEFYENLHSPTRVVAEKDNDPFERRIVSNALESLPTSAKESASSDESSGVVKIVKLRKVRASGRASTHQNTKSSAIVGGISKSTTSVDDVAMDPNRRASDEKSSSVQKSPFALTDNVSVVFVADSFGGKDESTIFEDFERPKKRRRVDHQSDDSLDDMEPPITSKVRRSRVPYRRNKAQRKELKLFLSESSGSSDFSEDADLSEDCVEKKEFNGRAKIPLLFSGREFDISRSVNYNQGRSFVSSLAGFLSTFELKSLAFEMECALQVHGVPFVPHRDVIDLPDPESSLCLTAPTTPISHVSSRTISIVQPRQVCEVLMTMMFEWPSSFGFNWMNRMGSTIRSFNSAMSLFFSAETLTLAENEWWQAHQHAIFLKNSGHWTFQRAGIKNMHLERFPSKKSLMAIRMPLDKTPYFKEKSEEKIHVMAVMEETDERASIDSVDETKNGALSLMAAVWPDTSDDSSESLSSSEEDEDTIEEDEWHGFSDSDSDCTILRKPTALSRKPLPEEFFEEENAGEQQEMSHNRSDKDDQEQPGCVILDVVVDLIEKVGAQEMMENGDTSMAHTLSDHHQHLDATPWEDVTSPSEQIANHCDAENSGIRMTEARDHETRVDSGACQSLPVSQLLTTVNPELQVTPSKKYNTPRAPPSSQEKGIFPKSPTTLIDEDCWTESENLASQCGLPLQTSTPKRQLHPEAVTSAEQELLDSPRATWVTPFTSPDFGRLGGSQSPSTEDNTAKVTFSDLCSPIKGGWKPPRAVTPAKIHSQALSSVNDGTMDSDKENSVEHRADQGDGIPAIQCDRKVNFTNVDLPVKGEWKPPRQATPAKHQSQASSPLKDSTMDSDEENSVEHHADQGKGIASIQCDRKVTFPNVGSPGKGGWKPPRASTPAKHSQASSPMKDGIMELDEEYSVGHQVDQGKGIASIQCDRKVTFPNVGSPEKGEWKPPRASTPAKHHLQALCDANDTDAAERGNEIPELVNPTKADPSNHSASSEGDSRPASIPVTTQVLSPAKDDYMETARKKMLDLYAKKGKEIPEFLNPPKVAMITLCTSSSGGPKPACQFTTVKEMTKVLSPAKDVYMEVAKQRMLQLYAKKGQPVPQFLIEEKNLGETDCEPTEAEVSHFMVLETKEATFGDGSEDSFEEVSKAETSVLLSSVVQHVQLTPIGTISTIPSNMESSATLAENVNNMNIAFLCSKNVHVLDLNELQQALTNLLDQKVQEEVKGKYPSIVSRPIVMDSAGLKLDAALANIFGHSFLVKDTPTCSILSDTMASSLRDVSIAAPQPSKPCISKPDLLDTVPIFPDHAETPAMTPWKVEDYGQKPRAPVVPADMPKGRRPIINLAFPLKASKHVSYTDGLVDSKKSYDDVVNSGRSGFRILSVHDKNRSTVKFPKYEAPEDDE